MQITYDENNVVTGYADLGGIDTLNSVYVENFTFEFPIREYKVIAGSVIHVGLSVEIQVKEFTESAFKAVQDHVDTQARSLRYDGINAIGKYLGYTNPFKAECEALGLWAANVWIVAEQIEADVLSGSRLQPTIDEVLLELPTY